MSDVEQAVKEGLGFDEKAFAGHAGRPGKVGGSSSNVVATYTSGWDENFGAGYPVVVVSGKTDIVGKTAADMRIAKLPAILYNYVANKWHIGMRSMEGDEGIGHANMLQQAAEGINLDLLVRGAFDVAARNLTLWDFSNTPDLWGELSGNINPRTFLYQLKVAQQRAVDNIFKYIHKSPTVTFVDANKIPTFALKEIEESEKGGTGSGNFGHAGRPGRIGGSSQSAVLDETVAKIATSIMDSNIEHLYFVKSDGTIVADYEGDAESVSTPKSHDNYLKNTIAIHNHPVSKYGTNYPPSDTDIITAAKYNVVRGFVITPDYVYEYGSKKAAWPDYKLVRASLRRQHNAMNIGDTAEDVLRRSANEMGFYYNRHPMKKNIEWLIKRIAVAFATKESEADDALRQYTQNSLA
jgi:hypothetical protein